MFEQIFDFSKGINLVYGEAATGKTTIAMQLSLETAKDGRRVIFIDSENGFSLERFKQIAGEDYSGHLGRIFLINVKDFFEQHKAIDSLRKIKNLGLVVVDTIGMHYRIAVRNDYASANRMLDKQFKALQELTRKKVNVLISNQVYSSVEDKNIKPLGGNMAKNWAYCVVKLENNPRKIAVEKPLKKELFFEIKNDGVTFY